MKPSDKSAEKRSEDAAHEALRRMGYSRDSYQTQRDIDERRKAVLEHFDRRDL